MSHNIEHRTYGLNCDKRKVEEELNNYVRHADWEEGCSGLYNGIRWIDHVCASYDDAMDYIEAHDRNNYDNLAVKYKVADNSVRNTAKYKELSERYERLCKEHNELDGVCYMCTVKSELVTCKCCGSKISTAHWKYNTCPVCRTDFRSPTTLNRIQAKRTAMEKAWKELNAYKASYADKHGRIEWLVKFEYHT